MHAAYIRPGGVAWDLPMGLLKDIIQFINQFISRIDEIEILLTNNKIWSSRLCNVGIVSKRLARIWGFTGVLLRGSGYPRDLRKQMPYEVYDSSN
jgi:NADH:ubiquinone oxidoreductase subunit D